MIRDEEIKIQVESLAEALDANGGHALSNPGLIEREAWVRIARYIPVDVIAEVAAHLKILLTRSV